MRHVLPFLLLLLLPGLASAQAYDLDAPVVVLHDVSFTVTVESEDVLFDETSAARYTLRMNGEAYPLTYQRDGERQLVAEELVVQGGPVSYELVREGTVVAQATSRSVPGWWSIVPPVLAILVALAFKRVIPALFLGVWVGAWVAIELSLTGLWRGLLEAFQVYVLTALADPDHAAIILFSLMIGGMVGIISKNGGTQGIVNKIVRWAKTPRKGQIATGILGLSIFFDDYANTLVVGNTMRPVTDRLRISREKLAYIVDSTAAPVSCLAFVTTWIGYEVGIIGEAVAKIPGFNESAYSIFLNSIPYSFYPILAIFFVFSVANSRRDFGAMYRAEYRALA
ncbi:MAG: Na+/H+ antiporter NhaC family protein, partial [Bacteroidetes bacterium]|nr:Na+/H+ antiporter NhaC family protein [Bacteroidota bacterium]